MKKILIIAAIIILGFVAYNPELADDGGEEAVSAIIRDYEFKTKAPCEGFSTNWLPFGRKVDLCDEISWYITYGYKSILLKGNGDVVPKERQEN